MTRWVGPPARPDRTSSVLDPSGSFSLSRENSSMNTRVTIMGHAGLFIEAGAERILVDPVLRTTPLASGSVVHTLKRSLDLTAMPRPTTVVVTHGHLDHFDPESLRTLDRAVR